MLINWRIKLHATYVHLLLSFIRSYLHTSHCCCSGFLLLQTQRALQLSASLIRRLNYMLVTYRVNLPSLFSLPFSYFSLSPFIHSFLSLSLYTNTVAKLANGYIQLIPPWLLISARSSHFCHCSVYNRLLHVSELQPQKYSRKWLQYFF